MGSARIKSREAAEEMLRKAKGEKDRERAQMALRMSAYYESGARARFPPHHVVEGARPRGAPLRRVHRRRPGNHGGGEPRRCRGEGPQTSASPSPCRRKNSTTPTSRASSPSTSTTSSCASSGSRIWRRPSSCFLAATGTLDELFELLTLVQTRKMSKPMPIVLFGTEYWREVIDFDALARHGTIDRQGYRAHATAPTRWTTAYQWIVRQLSEKALEQPGATL